MKACEAGSRFGLRAACRGKQLKFSTGRIKAPVKLSYSSLDSFDSCQLRPRGVLFFHGEPTCVVLPLPGDIIADGDEEFHRSSTARAGRNESRENSSNPFI